MFRPNNISYILAILFFISIASADTFAQEPEIEKALRDAGAKVEVYKTTTSSTGEKVDLNIYIFEPQDHQASDKRPAIVFFFGGGWRAGTPSQFTQHCKHLADRGMVAMTADYRVSSRHQTKATACVSDAKSAVRWIRKNAKRLGIDPERVAAGGGSAGGHVAACTGVIKTLDESTEDSAVSSVPNAMVLFNPALVLAPVDGQQAFDEKKMQGLKERFGAEPKTISPVHHVAAGAPPTIIFHGKADKTVAFWTAESFDKAMKAAGNRCELDGYEDQGHGFFNFSRKNGRYDETVASMDKFLVSLGYLEKQTANEAKSDR